eukprot:6358914-Prymnesium_polylepis.2
MHTCRHTRSNQVRRGSANGAPACRNQSISARSVELDVGGGITTTVRVHVHVHVVHVIVVVIVVIVKARHLCIGQRPLIPARSRTRALGSYAFMQRVQSVAHPSAVGSSGANDSVMSIVGCGATVAVEPSAGGGCTSPICVFWCSPRNRRRVISATVTALLTALP